MPVRMIAEVAAGLGVIFSLVYVALGVLGIRELRSVRKQMPPK